MYYTYILCSQSNNRYYIGQTKDIEKRLLRHNKGLEKSTKSGVPWVLVYKESFESRKEAWKREQDLKKLKSRKSLESFFKTEEWQSGLSRRS